MCVCVCVCVVCVCDCVHAYAHIAWGLPAWRLTTERLIFKCIWYAAKYIKFPHAHSRNWMCIVFIQQVFIYYREMQFGLHTCWNWLISLSGARISTYSQAPPTFFARATVDNNYMDTAWRIIMRMHWPYIRPHIASASTRTYGHSWSCYADTVRSDWNSYRYLTQRYPRRCREPTFDISRKSHDLPLISGKVWINFQA